MSTRMSDKGLKVIMGMRHTTIATHIGVRRALIVTKWRTIGSTV